MPTKPQKVPVQKGKDIIWLLAPYLLLTMLWLFAVAIMADDALFKWDRPVGREDGAALEETEIASYEIFKDGVMVGSVVNVKLEWLIPDVTSEHNGVYTIITIDTGGRRSVPSIPLVLEIEPANPNPAINPTVSILP